MSVKVLSSTSAKTGIAPTWWMAPAVAKNVNGVVRTPSPGPTPAARRARRKRVRAAGHADRVRDARSGREPGLEPRDDLAEDERLRVREPKDRSAHLGRDPRVLGAQIA